MKTTITMAGRVPQEFLAGSVRIEGRGWMDVESTTENTMTVTPAAPFRAARLEFNYRLWILLREVGIYRLVDWIADRLADKKANP